MVRAPKPAGEVLQSHPFLPNIHHEAAGYSSTAIMVVGLGFVALFTAAIAARIVDAEDDREHVKLLRRLDEQQAENREIKAQLRELSEAIKRL